MQERSLWRLHVVTAPRNCGVSVQRAGEDIFYHRTMQQKSPVLDYVETTGDADAEAEGHESRRVCLSAPAQGRHQLRPAGRTTANHHRPADAHVIKL